MRLKEETKDSVQVGFKVGDEVVISNSDDNYCHSKDGSIGKIKSIDEPRGIYYITFSYFSGEYYKTPCTFAIQPEHVSKLTKLHKALL